MYYANVGHSFLWYPYVLHVVHQTTSIFPYFCYGLVGTLSSLDPPSTPRWLDLSCDIGFLLVARIPANPLPAFETSVVAVDISSVVIVS
jgi:hypothetical protein